MQLQIHARHVSYLDRLRELTVVVSGIILCGDFKTVNQDNERLSSKVFKLSTEGKLFKEICEEAKLINVSLYSHLPF